MNFKTFLDNFDAIAEAPGGIPKLRSLILDLAMRGKLVPQNPEDEPVEKSLNAIALERIQLVKEGKLRKKQTTKAKVFDKSQFSVPYGWKVVQAEDAFLIVTDGDHQPPPKADDGIPFLVISNVSKGYLDFSQTRFVSQEYFDNLDWSKKPKKNDILYTVTGSYGISLIVETDQAFCVQRHIAILKTSDSLDKEYLKIALSSSSAKRHAYSVATGIAQKTVPLSGLRSLPIPLPPLAEQKRIVEKVDELMGLCDRYEAAKQTRDNLRQKLRGSAIASLMNAETDEELDAAWAFVRDNWCELSQHPEDVKDLRQSVLELAVQGKLVPQSPEDEPASVLIEKIKAEKHSQGIKTLNLSTIAIDEISKDIPQGWATEYLINLVLDFQNGISKRNSNKGEPVPVLRLADIKDGQLSEASLREIALTSDELNKYRVADGDILVIRVNGSANLVGQFIPCFTKRDWAYSDHLIRARLPLKFIHQKYLCLFSKTTRARTHIAGKTITTAGQKTVNQNGLSSLPVLVPPLAEQNRIVAKVDELMQLCDQLEASLCLSQQRAESLAASAISHLTI